ncbi:MAG: GerMN domain-containing protein [Bacillota bacterium]
MEKKKQMVGTRKILVLGIIFLLLGSLLSACSFLENINVFKEGKVKEKPLENPPGAKRPIVLSTEKSQIVVYYATADENFLVPVTISINPTKEVVQVAIEKLLAGPNNDFLKGPIPEGTKLREIYFREGSGTVFIDLTKQFLEMKTKEAVQLALDSIIYTLSEFPNVERFQIFVEGQLIGELQDVLLDAVFERENKINYIGDKSDSGAQITVYYGDDNAMFLVPVSIAGPKDGGVVEQAKAALNQLVKGSPKKGNLVSPLWKGTKIINVSWEEDKKLLAVNFSKEVVGYGGGTALERLLVNSLVFTLTSLPQVEKVQVLIEGQKVDYLPEGTDIYNPLERTEKLNCSQ